MSTVGRFQNGNLLITGKIDEVSPSVSSGVSARYPFTGNINGIDLHGNLLDTSQWQLGTNGSQGNFSRNGTVSENQIISYPNPWGEEENTWASLSNSETSESDGGWNVRSLPIDNTKTYRLSVWIKREDVGDGRTYFGCEDDVVSHLGSTTADGNPYFTSKIISQVPEMENNWLLWVGHIHPHDYTGSTHVDSGIYMMNGTKLAGCTDYKWMPDATYGGHRTYLYYSTSVNEKQYWVRPRMEQVNPSSSTINDLLSGCEEITHIYNYSDIDMANDGVHIEEETNNIIPEVEQDFVTGWSDYKEATVTRETGVYMSEFDCFGTKIQTSGGTSALKSHGTYVLAPSSDRYFSVQVKIQNIGDTDVIVSSNLGGQFGTIKPKESKLVKNEDIQGNGATHLQIQLRAPSATDSLNFIAGEPQVEEKKFSSFFVETSRPQSQLDIENIGGLTEYTVFGKFVPSTPLDGTYDYTPRSGALIRIQDEVNGGGFYYRYYAGSSGDGTSRPYLDPDGYYHTYDGGSGHRHEYYDISENEPVYYAIRKSGSTYSCKLYQNGVWKAEHSGNTNSDARLDTIRFGNHTLWSGVHSNLTIYERSLSDREVDKLLKNFSITKDGDLRTNVNEYPSILLVEDQTKNLYDNTYKSFGTWTLENTDVTEFVEADNTLGTTVMVGKVYLSDPTYYPTMIEYTKENNTKGFKRNMGKIDGGTWTQGWNTFYAPASGYQDEANTPWDNMTRLEFYRSGTAEGVDTTQTIRLQDVRLVKVDYDPNKPRLREKAEHTNVIEVLEYETL